MRFCDLRRKSGCLRTAQRSGRLSPTGLESLAKFDRMRHRLMQLVFVEFAFREADDDAGNAIADEIGQCAAFAHELIDTDENGDRLDRYVRHNG